MVYSEKEQDLRNDYLIEHWLVLDGITEKAYEAGKYRSNAYKASLKSSIEKEAQSMNREEHRFFVKMAKNYGFISPNMRIRVLPKNV